jgi:hypothetical protein
MKNPFKKYGLFGWNYWHLITHPWVLVREWYFYIKWFWQRGQRGWADCDAWSLDTYLSGWLPQALDRLLANKYGYPVGMTRSGWETRLKRMKRGFITAQAIGDMQYDTVRDTNRAHRQMKRDLAVFAEHFLSLWD